MMPPDPRIAPACDIFEVQGYPQLAGAKHTPQRATRLEELQAFAVGHSTRDLVDYLLKGHSKGYFHHPGVGQVSRKAQDGGALAAVLAYSGEPITALVYYLGDVGEGLDVVYVAGLAK
jgi:hypothetical protein